ncbi:MAG TPA: protein kinase [Thermoanaerobaculia bacterium]|nr:protein kinase [Thermoanaerobaculia bacterium]
MNGPLDGVRFARLKEEFQALLGADRDRREEALQRISAEDAALGAELAAWLSAEEADAAAWLEQPAVLGLDTEEETLATAALPERVGPWRLMGEIGRGGMGSVFLGRRDDGAFEQTVAVKLVRAELASDLLRRRFLAERRILAGLVHPHIAHLIDGGATPDGVPYLVLEHVAGEPIDRYCERRALPVEARLRLFLVVCGAVDFAHRKLVLHRDIKPGNVLVDETGTPKLLDFGIAKLLEASSAEEAGEDWTALGGARPLTPEWASPEQVRGDALTTASDVYSLGVLLHVLLSGRRPQPSQPFRGESEKSGVDRRALRGDLQQIVARALAPEIDHRYGTVGELAADLDRHLSGRPVLAHPPSLRYRFGKLIRRHRAAFAGATVATVGLLVGSVVSLRQAHLAEIQRQRADRRFADVRRIANVALLDIHDKLESVPGAMPARRLLVDTALRYLDDLAAEARDEPALLDELSVAYERVAEIQGMPGWSSEGRTGNALASLQRALALIRRSRASASADRETAKKSHESEARLLLRIGSVLAARGETRAALAHHREALGLLRRRVAEAPSTPLRLALAQAQVAVGDDYWERGDLPAANDRFREALATCRATSAGDPASLPAARQVGVVEQRLGDVASALGNGQQALAHHAASLAVDRALAARQPDDLEIQRDLGTDLSRLAVDQRLWGSAARELALHQEASRLRERLLAEEPGDARAAEDAAESRMEVGKALGALGRTAEAKREIGLAVLLLRGLIARDSQNVKWRDALASALVESAKVEARSSDRQAADTALAEALAIRRKLLAESPDLAGNRDALAELERKVASGSQPP